MEIWKFRGFGGDFSGCVHADGEDVTDQTFVTDGAPKAWATKPRLEPFIEKNKKKQRKIGDISYITPGSIVLSQRAYLALHDFLAPFGQFLEVECINTNGTLCDEAKESEIRYFYNVTNMIACIDYDKSGKIGSGVSKEVFFPELIPQDVQVFKDPLRKRVEIYLSRAAKDVLCKLIADQQITGAVIAQV